MSTYERSRDMVELGTYQAGGNAELDAAIRLVPRINAFLAQKIDEFQPRAAAFQRLKELMR